MCEVGSQCHLTPTALQQSSKCLVFALVQEASRLKASRSGEELTVRSILVGCMLGALVGASNICRPMPLQLSSLSLTSWIHRQTWV